MKKVVITSTCSAFREIKHLCPDDWAGDYKIEIHGLMKRILKDAGTGMSILEEIRSKT